MGKKDCALPLIVDMRNRIGVHNDHILSALIGKDNSTYYSYLEEAMKMLDEANMAHTLSIRNKLFDKLLLGTNISHFNSNTYLQGVSEIVFWIYACKNGLSIEVDYKCNAGVNKKDVDIRLEYEGCYLNLEVKCPEQDEYDPNKIIGMFANRISGITKLESDEMMSAIEEKIGGIIEQYPELGYTDVERRKINDNKIIDYMLSAQEKFSDSDDEINVLVISLPSNQMQDYFRFLGKNNSGILCGGLHMFNHKEKDFDKIDYIMLTNIVSGHDKEVMINPWDLSNYCNLLLKNPYSKRSILPETVAKVLGLIPNDGSRYNNLRESKIGSTQLLVEDCLLNEFLVKNYPKLYNPQEIRESWFKSGEVCI